MVVEIEPGKADKLVEEMRTECERRRDMVGELARIHLSIDKPDRSIGPDEPEWICRLRKICLHAKAIETWEIGGDSAHVIAPEVRAAFRQLCAVWESMPQDFKLDEIDSDWWPKRARDGTIAMYDHPTPVGLSLLRLGRGVFPNDEVWASYIQIASWLISFGMGYGLALLYLAEFMGVKEDVNSRLEAAIALGLDELTQTVHTMSYISRDPVE